MDAVISIISKDYFSQAMLLGIIFSSILLGIALIVGFISSVLQAATQIQEQTLSYVPKIIAIGVSLFFLGQWMLEQLLNYTVDILTNLPHISHEITSCLYFIVHG